MAADWRPRPLSPEPPPFPAPTRLPRLLGLAAGPVSLPSLALCPHPSFPTPSLAPRLPLKSRHHPDIQAPVHCPLSAPTSAPPESHTPTPPGHPPTPGRILMSLRPATTRCPLGMNVKPKHPTLAPAFKLPLPESCSAWSLATQVAFQPGSPSFLPTSRPPPVLAPANRELRALARCLQYVLAGFSAPRPLVLLPLSLSPPPAGSQAGSWLRPSWLLTALPGLQGPDGDSHIHGSWKGSILPSHRALDSAH